MNFAFSLLVIVLLCDGSLNKIAAQVDNGLINVNRNGNARNRTKFTDIVFDVMEMILDLTDVTDLMNLSRAVPTLSPLTTAILDHRNSEFFIHSVSPNDYIDATKYNEQFSCDFFVEKKRAETDNFEIALKTLEHCGPIIRRLTFGSAVFNETETKQIAEYINKFGSNTLNYLNLNGIRTYTLEQFTVPFTEIEELEFEVCYTGTKSKYPLDQLFPKLQWLNLHLFTNTSFDFLTCEYPHLEHLFLRLHMDAQLGRRDEIAEIFRKNPQIRSLSVNIYQIDFLIEVSKMLPNLENLILPSNHQFGSEPFSFDQVKKLEFQQFIISTMEMISFPRLESLKMIVWHQYYGNWMEFIERHTHLKVLHMDWNGYDEHDRLLKLTDKLPELIELSIKPYDRVSSEIINQIINSHEELKTFELSLIFVDTKMQADLINIRAELEDDWDITETDYYFLAKKSNNQ